MRVAVVQPHTHRPPEDERNLADAVQTIAECADRGAELVAFPETYPGPWRLPATFDPVPALVEAASRHGVFVQFGTLEPIEGTPRSGHNVLALAWPDGRPPDRYRRTHPLGPWIYTGGPYWDFDYVAADEFPVFETPLGVLGLAMCSEVYVPEVVRRLALNGAEVILLPAGSDKKLLWKSWRHLIWARAIENLAVVITTQNLLSPGDRGLAMVASPEDVLFETTTAGTFLVDIDLSRVRELRQGTDRVGSASINAVKAGLLTQWHRPELYGRPGAGRRD
jgi:predicted amidohydrolase